MDELERTVLNDIVERLQVIQQDLDEIKKNQEK